MEPFVSSFDFFPSLSLFHYTEMVLGDLPIVSFFVTVKVLIEAPKRVSLIVVPKFCPPTFFSVSVEMIFHLVWMPPQTEL